MRTISRMRLAISQCFLNFTTNPYALSFHAQNQIFSLSRSIGFGNPLQKPCFSLNHMTFPTTSVKPFKNPSHQIRSLGTVFNSPNLQSDSGELHLIVGPMFAGKTTTLLKRIKAESSNGSFQAKGMKHIFHIDETLKDLCLSGKVTEAVGILCQTKGQVEAETYSLLLQDCIFRKEYRKGRRVHWQMVIVGFQPNEYLHVKLLILYAKAGDLNTARIIFDKLYLKCSVSWNAMITGYVQKGFEEVGLKIYHEMRKCGLRPDQYTFTSVFKACASLAILEQGKQVHALWIKSQRNRNLVVNNALMDMYFKCSSLSDGHLVFENFLDKTVITWSTLITGYGQHGRVVEVRESFHRMIKEGFRPNHITFLAVLCACSHAGLVTEAWEYFTSMMRDYGLQPGREHYAAMVDVLGRAGRLHDAYKLVICSPWKEHPVLWGALLGACKIHGNVDMVKLAAENYFQLEQENAGKYVVLSNAYASFGLWDTVAKIRSFMKESRMRKDPSFSMIEIQKEVHFFYKVHNTHQHIEQIHKLIKDLSYILKDSGHVPDFICE